MVTKPFARGKLRLLNEKNGAPLVGIAVRYNIKSLRFEYAPDQHLDVPSLPRNNKVVSDDNGEVELSRMVSGIEYEIKVGGVEREPSDFDRRIEDTSASVFKMNVMAGRPGELSNFGEVRIDEAIKP